MENINAVVMPNLACPKHRQPIVRGCCDFNCRKAILLCSMCVQEDAHLEHPQSVLDFAQFLLAFPQQLSALSTANRAQLKSHLQRHEQSDIFKAIQNQRAHLERIGSNIEAQKLRIAQDLTVFEEEIMLGLQALKNTLFGLLNSALDSYKKQFEEYQRKFAQAFSLASNYYYTSPPTFVLKLASMGEMSK